MRFEIVREITDVATIAEGPGVRDRHRLRRLYGGRHWRKMKGVAVASAERKSSASGMSARSRTTRRQPAVRFAVCIENSAYPASLELHKIYWVLRDDDAAADGDLRVVTRAARITSTQLTGSLL